MDTHNPYAPSPASLKVGRPTGAEKSADVWRDGSLLVLRHGALLPMRCVKCNEDAGEPIKKRKLYWHHSGIYAIILINVVIYAVVAMIVRKSAVVYPGLCDEHLKRRRWVIGLSWLGVLVGIAVMLGGLAQDRDLVGALGIVMLFITIVLGMILSRIVYPKRIDKEYVRLKGCGAEFLDSLPHFPR